MVNVSGKDVYPLAIRLNNEKSIVKIEYKDYKGEFSQGKLTEDIKLMTGEVLEVLIIVEAENGNQKTYTLTVTSEDEKTQIKGKIITENFEGKYISEVSIYKAGTHELILKNKTNEDGSFEIELAG